MPRPIGERLNKPPAACAPPPGLREPIVTHQEAFAPNALMSNSRAQDYGATPATKSTQFILVRTYKV